MAFSGDGPGDVGRVLADRLAAVLVHHEPGWRLPRPTALARRHHVRPAEIEEAMRELAARHLIRQLPDGQFYRASPAEYLIPVSGVPALAAHVDPMGAQVLCRSRKVSWRRVPEDIGWTLGIEPAQSACSVRCQWSVNGEPAAISTTYLTRQVAAQIDDWSEPLGGAPALPLGNLAESIGRAVNRGPAGVPGALHIELQPPPSAVARGLRLAAGQSAAMVTVRFDGPGGGPPVALTVGALRPEVFRIVIQAPAGDPAIRSEPGAPDGSPSLASLPEPGAGPVLFKLAGGSGS